MCSGQYLLGARLCRVQQRAMRVVASLRCFCLCICNQEAYTDNSADAVDRRFHFQVFFNFSVLTFHECVAAHTVESNGIFQECITAPTVESV